MRSSSHLRYRAPPCSRNDASGEAHKLRIRRGMASERQRAAARRNVRKAAAAAKRKRTIAHLPKRTRTALGKQANKVKRLRAGR